MLVTPFDPVGEILYGDLDRLVDHLTSTGIDGLAILGLYGEASRLNVDERIAVMRRVVSRIAGRWPLIVGTSANTTADARQLTSQAAAEGATAIMVAPPVSTGITRDELWQHYVEVAKAAAGSGIMIQDAPTFLGVSIDPGFICDLAAQFPNVQYVKSEAVPLGEKMISLGPVRELGVSLFAGMSGLNCVEVLDAGAQGLIPGCELSKSWALLYRAYSAGNRDQAMEIYRGLAPLLAFTTQSLDFGIACCKQLLLRGGLISSAALRTDSPLGAWSLQVLAEHAQAASAV